jgi:hypothetical protein
MWYWLHGIPRVIYLVSPLFLPSAWHSAVAHSPHERSAGVLSAAPVRVGGGISGGQPWPETDFLVGCVRIVHRVQIAITRLMFPFSATTRAFRGHAEGSEAPRAMRHANAGARVAARPLTVVASLPESSAGRSRSPRRPGDLNSLTINVFWAAYNLGRRHRSVCCCCVRVPQNRHSPRIARQHSCLLQ